MNCFVSHLQTCLLLTVALGTGTDRPVRVLSQIDRFDEAPSVVLPRLVSPEEEVDVQKLDRPVVLIFGEPYNERTQESLTQLKKAYETVGLTEADLGAFLIVSHAPDQEQTARLHEKGKIHAEILLDNDLKAFGDYGVAVLPSTVVIDGQARVDLAISGLPLSYTDMVANAILLSTGRITSQQYESLGSPVQETKAQGESVTGAGHLASLAGQLMKRGYTSLALERYREALQIDESYLPAKVGVARCLVKMNLLLDAMTELQEILKVEADHVEATLIIAQVEIMRGGDGIEEAKTRLQRLLALHPDHPEADYLMGMVCETQGQVDHAMGYYKKAANRLLETVVR